MTDTQEQGLQWLLIDVKELTETNAHGEALEKIATFFNRHQLRKAFEAINTLHLLVGSLDSSLERLRGTFAQEMFRQIEHTHGEDVLKAVKSCL
jgi:hypothetical protein